MGLILDLKTDEVIVDHTSKEHLHTTEKGNPVLSRLGPMQVHSVFRRLKASGKNRRNRSAKQIGDNCPLIYALKGSENLWVSRHSIKQLNTYIPLIISTICDALEGDVDCIVLIPSRHPLAKMLASRLGKAIGIPVHEHIFRKATFFEASTRVRALLSNKANIIGAGVSPDDEKRLRRIVKVGMQQAAAPYSAKDIGTSLRQHFDPLKFRGGTSPLGTEDRVLFVDDLLATGETLLAAHDLLYVPGEQTSSRAATWFSKV
ncbi:hypothetical protein [Phaeobacter inhibens]|uniref:hypothetical protein n=1 Tax=Phaeobacter inhibens TaxID=221822 RepID=UPI0012EBDAC2|nr:hypothetical protein [Phaeobacter inhibens]